MKTRTRGWKWGRTGVPGALKGSAVVALTALSACSEVRNEEQSRQTPQSVAAINGVAAEQGPTPIAASEPTVDGTSPVASAPAAPSAPPAAASLQVAQQWAWTGSETLSAYKQVMMQPVVVDVNRDGTPDIVFSAFDGEFYNAKARAGENANVNGVLRAISGKTGTELWAVANAEYRVKPAASIAAGDIDGDGAVEICGIPENGRGIICFENDGAFKFRSAPDAYDYNEWGGPSLADLDGDGKVEILDGNRVYTNTGALKWVGSQGMDGALYTGPVSFAADIDQDGKQEVINGRSVYRHDGSLKCTNTQIPGGFSGVANFDADAAGEIVVAGHGQVSLLDDDCSLLWTRDVHYTDPGQSFPTGRGHGGAPNIADFDGDGQLEIGLAGDWNYTVYGTDGAVKWTFPIQEYSSGKTTSTTFDFEGDGRTEVIYADELRVRIFDGVTGGLRWETTHSSGTTHEYPIVADVDGDGAAEIVVTENNHAAPGFNGIRVFGDDSWVGTRRIWNQHAYAVTNVNDDGTIPARPATNWLTPGLNNFRSNAPGTRADVCQVKGTWKATGSLALQRIHHTTTLLKDGRQVLTAGGFNTTSELYDVASGTWKQTGDTLATHRYHTMTLLPDGRVLIAGGGACDISGASSELYYPELGRWKTTGSLVVFRSHHTATLLPNGKVLVTGGENASGSALSSVELYDPATGTWSLAGNMGAARRDHTATLLPNGKVLVAGGSDNVSELLTSAELYDPESGTWTPVGAMGTPRSFHSATLLPNGKVLAAGGGSWDIASGSSAELFDPATGRWTATGSMVTPRRFHTATLLPNGKLLAVGGYHQATGILTAAEFYDPSTGTWCSAGSLNVDRYGHTATLLPDGRVLATAGVSSKDQPITQASAELFGLGGISGK
ncbi:kelch repeat-containing protein [Archangium lipolyticum]|uniref:kelch repeat-containing protein n=1 Tax=Archangium lipolyticum TaxID=2970465 RepID=UPI00214A4787|nr:kelch repeat-containing protein [Archangium lipolyticum]